MKEKNGHKSKAKPITVTASDPTEMIKVSITIPRVLLDFAERRAALIAELTPGMRPNVSMAMRDILTNEKRRVEKKNN